MTYTFPNGEVGVEATSGFISGQLLIPIDQKEDGTTVNMNRGEKIVFTGTSSDGNTQSTCGNWDTTAGFATRGSREER